VFPRWLELVTANGAHGKRAHDARLVAVMLANGVTRVLTLNAADFAGLGEVTVLSLPDSNHAGP
jgi:predicted nucleic acid-binding protein